MSGEGRKLSLGVVGGRTPIGEIADPRRLVGKKGDEPGGQLGLLVDGRRCGDVDQLGDEPVGGCRAAGGKRRAEVPLPAA